MNKLIMLILIIAAVVLAVKYLGAPSAVLYGCAPVDEAKGLCTSSQLLYVKCRGQSERPLELENRCNVGQLPRFYCQFGALGRNWNDDQGAFGLWSYDCVSSAYEWKYSDCSAYDLASYKFDGTLYWYPSCGAVPPIVKPEPSQTLWNILSSAIMDWLKSIFRFFTGSITSSQGSVAPGQNIIFTVSLSSPIDSNCSDGSCQVQYASWAVVDKSGNILQSSPWRETVGSWTESVTIAAPSTAGDYAFVGVLYNYQMRYVGAWTTESEGIAAREAVEFTVGIPGVVKPVPSAGLLGSIINSIFNFIRSLFGWLV